MLPWHKGIHKNNNNQENTNVKNRQLIKNL
jgi:hypothetical protein